MVVNVDPSIEEKAPVELTLIIIFVVCLILFVSCLKGVIQTFQRQPVVAILCIIFLMPAYVCWVLVEMIFLDPPRR